VSYLVSDRAKALITLAETGLNCLSIPDVFHLSHDLAKGYSLSIFGRLRQAQQVLVPARQRLAALQASQPGSAQVQQVPASVEACEAVVACWQGVRSAYRQRLANLSRIVHPWRLVDATRQTSQEVERQLHGEIQVLENVTCNAWIAGEKGHLGQGPQTACRRLGPDRRLVADGVA
jgi:hypothetical protein